MGGYGHARTREAGYESAGAGLARSSHSSAPGAPSLPRNPTAAFSVVPFKTEDNTMLGLITVGIAGVASGFGYFKARHFVRDRLRYVDAAQKRITPWLAGFVTALAAAPLVALLPLVGGGTALLLGLSVGLGVAHGARDVRTGVPYRLTP